MTTVFGRLPGLVFVGCALALGGLGLACGPNGGAAVATAPTDDPFAVVRATSQAAYQAGKAALDRGDLIRGCPAIDTASTNDPDHRADIQQALAQCLTQIPLLLATDAPAVVSQRTIGMATLTPLPFTPARASAATTAQPAASAATAPSQPSAAGQSSPTAALAAAGATNPAAALAGAGATNPATPLGAPPQPNAATSAAVTATAATLVVFRDPQGRFTLGAPADWTLRADPQAPFGFGTGVVQFRDPSGRAAFDVAVDTSARAVSPELYAASMELAMAQQVAGYANEQALPVSVSGTPAVRRIFTFTQRDPTGRDLQARALEVSVVKGQTPYIITGAVTAEQFQQFSPTFDQMVESFRFS